RHPHPPVGLRPRVLRLGRRPRRLSAAPGEAAGGDEDPGLRRPRRGDHQRLRGVGRQGELIAVAGGGRRWATAGTPYPSLPPLGMLSSVGLTTEWHRRLLPTRPLLPSLALPAPRASPEAPFSSTRKGPRGSSCFLSGVRSWARSCTWAT